MLDYKRFTGLTLGVRQRNHLDAERPSEDELETVNLREEAVEEVLCGDSDDSCHCSNSHVFRKHTFLRCHLPEQRRVVFNVATSASLFTAAKCGKHNGTSSSAHPNPTVQINNFSSCYIAHTWCICSAGLAHAYMTTYFKHLIVRGNI